MTSLAERLDLIADDALILLLRAVVGVAILLIGKIYWIVALAGTREDEKGFVLKRGNSRVFPVLLYPCKDATQNSHFLFVYALKQGRS